MDRKITGIKRQLRLPHALTSKEIAANHTTGRKLKVVAFFDNQQTKSSRRWLDQISDVWNVDDV